MRLRLPSALDRFGRVLAADTEYTPRPGELPRGICYCDEELRTGETSQRWVWGRDPGPCPWSEDDLLVCFSAGAELSFALSCGWPLPRAVFDLWIAWRLMSNGRKRSNLLTALKEFGIQHAADDFEKARWRQRCIRGGPFSTEDAIIILAYCMSDVRPLGDLLVRLCEEVDVEQILEFGSYALHAARVEQRGMSIDVPRVQLVSQRWPDVLASTAMRANTRMRFQIYGGRGRPPTSRSYRQTEEWFRRTGLIRDWPRTETGQLALDQDTLRSHEGRHPDLVHFRQSEKVLNLPSPEAIAIGPDGRCRTPIGQFSSRTGRNQMKPVTPLALAGAMRAFMVPTDGCSLLVADFEQADPGVGAALSIDTAMLEDYGLPEGLPDFYLSFAARVGAIPPGTTREDPKVEATRNQYKVGSCAIMYGSEAFTLSQMLGVPLDVARSIIRRHKAAYPDYWRWVRSRLAQAQIDGFLATASGWVAHNLRGPSAMNFLVQATGADILRLASLLADRAGLPVVFPLHDSLGVEIPARNVLDATRELVRVMGDASEAIIGMRLRVSVQVVGPGERWLKDPKAKEWWLDISRQLGVDP